MTELQIAELTQEIKSGGELLQLRAIPPLEIFDKEKIPILMGQIKTIVGNMAIGQSAQTEAGREEIKSLAYKVARIKNEFKRIATDATSEWKTKINEVDRLQKKVWGELQELQDSVKQPVTEWEAGEAKRKQMQLDHIAELTQAQITVSRDWDMMTVESLRERLEDIRKEFDTHYWQEFKVEGEKAYKNAVAEFELAIGRKIKLDSERQELEKLRKERESFVQFGQKQPIELPPTAPPPNGVTPADRKMEEIREKNNLIVSDFVNYGLDVDSAKKALAAIYRGKVRFIKLEY
jgi:hypothetical protein